ncbi:MAG TPA: winged helix-turn-helix domain-containing protein [Xanthomonadales bacterium]|nr:winged helix-turn-helix domain-containing protein [Xanthomonadales bacterium]
MVESQATIYEFGEFRVDTGKRLLFDRDGQTLSLTPKAFDTLLYLLENKSVIVKKDELIKAVWPTTIVEENNLNQNISTLRRVLGESKSEHKYIVTVPGRGYRFVANVQSREMGSQAAATTIPSIAVLPFLPLVTEHRDLALELGMADTLIARLSSIQKLIVRPINSVRKYVDAEQDPLLAGRELGVDSVLEGSIQRGGEAIRVTVRMLDVATGAGLWAGTFDEKFADIFSVQDAISEKVVAALSLQLGFEDRQRLIRRQARRPEVYELYLKGRYHFFRLTLPEMQTAISYFQQAIAKDPNYARAHIGLASCLFRMPLAAEQQPEENFPKAKTAAQRALELDPSLAEGHAILGWILFWHEWNWAESESQFLQAQALNPNEVESHLGYAHLLSNTGRHEEALSEVKRARELDPLYLLANALECQFLIHAGQLVEAQTRLTDTLALDASFWLTHLYSSSLCFEQERFSDAAKEASLALRLSGGSPTALSASACALQKSGNTVEAKSALNDLLKLSESRFVSPYNIAVLYCCLDEADQVFTWLERGVEQKDPRMTFLAVDPKWRNLHSKSKFQDILRRVGLLNAW